MWHCLGVLRRRIPSLMPASFRQRSGHDEDGRLVIKSTCKTRGAFRFVNVRDGSLAKWESEHECSDMPKIPAGTGHIVR
jgi:hypothetical protein